MREESREVTIRIDEDHTGRNYLVTASVGQQVLQHYKMPLIQSIIEAVKNRLVERYLEEHGDALLEELSPGVMKTLVANQIAKKVLG